MGFEVLIADSGFLGCAYQTTLRHIQTKSEVLANGLMLREISFLAQLIYRSTLSIEAVRFFETSEYLYQIICRQIPEKTTYFRDE
jgi:hypothetical protein